MMRRRLAKSFLAPLLAAAVAGSAAPWSVAAPEDASAATATKKESSAGSNAPTARIDQEFAALWRDAEVQPAALADDAAFLRRVTLDLVGRIPLPAEVERFERDASPTKREEAVDRLLKSPGWARHWASLWRRVALPQADTPQFAALGPRFEGWLQRELAAGRPIDQLVAETILPMPIRSGERASAVASASFLAAGEFKPESLAANSARAYLGLNIDCAQCHDHPFSSWTRRQFWEYAAFFAKPGAEGDGPERFTITIPETTETVAARLLTGGEAAWPEREKLADDSGRRTLAAWMTARDNPYFARNVVNRVWAQLFGLGLVEPLDDLSDRNPSPHSKLLAELAESFAADGCDLRKLVRAIVTSKPYQLSGAHPEGRPVPPPELFARAIPRGLTGEQLYDSVRTASGLPLSAADPDDPQADGARRSFAERFRADRESTTQRSILQSLEMLNGPLTSEAVRSPALAAIADSPWLGARGRLDALFLSTLARRPSDSEANELLPLVDLPESAPRRAALANVFWVLLNSAEFSVNH